MGNGPDFRLGLPEEYPAAVGSGLEDGEALELLFVRPLDPNPATTERVEDDAGAYGFYKRPGRLLHLSLGFSLEPNRIGDLVTRRRLVAAEDRPRVGLLGQRRFRPIICASLAD